MFIARIVVYGAILASLIFNAAYAFARGSTIYEQATLVLVAIIIDLAKTSFLAGAGILRDRRHYLSALILFVLWWPAFALSAFSAYSNVAAWRATSATVKSSASETRDRAQARYDQARRQRDLINAAPQFAATAGCTQIRAKDQAAQAFCTRVEQANAELQAADAALSAPPSAGKADTEIHLLAAITGLPKATLDFLAAFVPAVFVELLAALGLYAISRPGTVARPAATEGSRTAAKAVSQVRPGDGGGSVERPSQTSAAAPVKPDRPAPGAALILRPGN